jgi:hypothetical protein
LFTREHLAGAGTHDRAKRSRCHTRLRRSNRARCHDPGDGDDCGQLLSIPIPATEDCLLPPGPGSRAASVRIKPVLRCSSPSRPFKNTPALVATRSYLNNGRIGVRISRSDAAHNASVTSTDAVASTTPESWFPMDSEAFKNSNCNANQMLASIAPSLGILRRLRYISVTDGLVSFEPRPSVITYPSSGPNRRFQ